MTTATVNTIEQIRTALADAAIDTIYVEPGSYLVDTAQYLGGTHGFVVARDVTIAVVPGSAGRADFVAGMDFAKGLFFVTQGASVSFEGIGFIGTRSTFGPGESSNEAAIRFEGEALTIRDSLFSDNRNAILGTSASDTASLTIRNSQFTDNGTASGQEHTIYFEGDSVDIEGSQITGFGDGHAIKTVAHLTRLVNTLISDGGYGMGNHPVDLEGGGSLIATGNQIIKSSNAANYYAGNPYVFFVGGFRSNDDAGAVITIADNIISSQYLNSGGQSGTLLLGNFSGAQATISGNQLSGLWDATVIANGQAVMDGNLVNGDALPLHYDWHHGRIAITSGADHVTLDSASGYYDGEVLTIYDGLGGNDTLISGSSGYHMQVIDGGDGNDILIGNLGNDELYGGAGDDVILSGDGAQNRRQLLVGGAGNDSLVARTAMGNPVLMLGGEGNDLLDGRHAGVAAMNGGSGNDTLLGSASTDDFSGGAGDDVLFGGSGSEHYIYGGAGSDTFVYAGNYGTDLDVTLQYGVNVLVSAVAGSSAGQAEVGEFEHLHEIEFIQFGNGTYTVASGLFTPDALPIDTAALMAPNFDSIAALASSESSGGESSPNVSGLSGTIAFPYTTTITAYAPDLMAGSAAGDFMLVPVGTAYTLALGKAGNDHLVIENWNSAASGGAGNDVIEVRNFAKLAGDDAIDVYGTVTATMPQRGADHFVFDVTAFTGEAWAMDRAFIWASIADYDDGLDKIFILHGGVRRDAFADLTITQVGDDAVISAYHMARIVLKNTSAAALDESDFYFAHVPQHQTIIGTSLADTLAGSDGNDTITGLAGNDLLVGGAGNDLFVLSSTSGQDSIDGGSGTADTIRANTANVRVNLASTSNVEVFDGAGKAGFRLIGSIAADTIDLGTATLIGVERIDGGDGNDTITGSAGNDVIAGGMGHDSLQGGMGDDTFIAGADCRSDTFIGGEGTDRIVATVANTSIAWHRVSGIETIDGALTSNLIIEGRSLNDTIDLSGVALINVAAINGGSGNDTIIASHQADTLIGGIGADQLTGNGGGDTFVFQTCGQSKPGSRDTITDFTADDTLDLAAIDASAKADGNQAFTWIGAGAFTGTAGELRTYLSGGDTFVQGDTNGDKVADLVIKLAGLVPLSDMDFVL